MTKAEKKLWESRKRAEELGAFDEMKRIHKMLRKDRRKRQKMLSKKSK